jgi:hypothetical protein
MTLDGRVTTIYTFSLNGPDGLRDGVVQASDGYLYGRTWNGNWSIFRLRLDGSDFQTIHLSTVGGVGYCGALVEGPDQNLYGAVSGDPISDQSTIFRITPTGSYSVLFIIDRFFRSFGSLVFGADGALYGTTVTASPSSFPGTVFRFTIP